MCGFLFSKDGKLSEYSLFEALDAQRHRGPDDQRVHSLAGNWFGHNRLKVIDLEGAVQPMIFSDHILLFNGEIYNYLELRIKLEKLGYSFQTSSDTEVVLKMFLEFKNHSFSMFRGMFAICIYDVQKNKIHIARDSFGIKPLYLRMDEDSLVISSEIKSIKKLFKDDPVKTEALLHYLKHRYVPLNTSIWKKIKKVLPGQYLKIDGNSLAIEKKEIINIKKLASNTSTDVQSQFEDHFRATVGMHLKADVPIGIALSGGLDSTAIAIAAFELGHRNIQCYSVGFSGDHFSNENSFAADVAEKLSYPIEQIYINESSFIKGLHRHVATLEEPNADLASIPLQYLCDRAANSVKVLLSGEGADEVLAGYDLEKRYLVWRVFNFMRGLPQPLRKVICKIKKIRKFFEVNKLNVNKSLFENIIESEPNISNVFTFEEIKKLFRLKKIQFDNLPNNLDELKHSDYSDILKFTQQRLCQSWLVEDLLMRSDKVSMQSSIEMRVPFLEPQFGKWCLHRPLNQKIKFNFLKFKYQNKVLLRHYCEKRGFGKIVNRPKQGFSIPVYSWLGTKLKDWVDDILFGVGAKLVDSVGETNLLNFFESIDLRMPTHQHKLWNLIILELWLRDNPNAQI